MQIQFKAKEFLNKFKVVASAASTKNRNPILENVKIVANEKSGVLLTATDIEHGICCRVNATVVEKGQALVPAKEFCKLLNSAKNETVTLESVDATIMRKKTKVSAYKPIMTWGNNRFEFEPTDPDNFPNVAEFTEKSYYKIEPLELLHLLEHTMFAADVGKDHNSGSRVPGVWLEDQGKKISAVCTNGKHLAVQDGQGVCVGKHQLSWMSNGNEPRALYPVIPILSLKTLVKALKEKSINYPSHVKMAFVASKKDNPAKTHLLLDAGEVGFCSRLLEARSLEWQFIVPDTGGKSPATVESGQLHAAIKNSKIIPSTAYSGMILTFERNKLTVSGQKKDGSTAKLSVAMKYSGKKVDIELNRECFMAMLQALDGNIRIFTPVEPGGVLKVDVNDEKFSYFLMTMK